jgi:hypothetical protein
MLKLLFSRRQESVVPPSASGFAVIALIAFIIGEDAFARENLRSRSRLREVPNVAVHQKYNARDFYEKTYNRDNLEKNFRALPARAPTLGQDAWRVFSQTAGRVSKHNSDSRNHRRVLEMYNRAPVPTLESEQLRHAAGHLNSEYQNTTNPNEIIQHLNGHYKAEINDAVVSQIPFWHQITGGWDFSFGYNGNSTSSPGTASVSSPVRYGLVLKDVKASESKAMYAALGSDDMRDWQNVPSATAEWTIGPIETSESELYRVDVPPASEYVAQLNAYQHENRRLDQSVVSFLAERISIPKPLFKGKAKLRSAPTPGATSLPGVDLTLSQIEGYYALNYLTTSTLAKDGVFHTIRLPIFGPVAATRKFDENGKPLEFGLTDGKVNVLCNEVSGSFKTESVHAFGNKSIKVVTEAPNGCPMKDRKIHREGQKYAVEYNMSF